MGNSISMNFTDIKPAFEFGYWKVHEAKKKSNGEKVSLWVIEYPILKAKERNTKERHRFMQHLINSLHAQQKLNHPNILKIYDINDKNMKELAFSSERVKYLDLLMGEYSRDEAIYISHQLAGVLRYLHEEIKLAYLGISPENITYTKNLQLKLTFFHHACKFKDKNQPIVHPFSPWANDSFHCQAAYQAPEIIGHQQSFCSADVFMYGLFLIHLFTSKDPMKAKDASDYSINDAMKLVPDLPDEFQDLAKPCLRQEAVSRPTFLSVSTDEAFSSTVCDVFTYINTISSKDNKDIFNFLTGLSDIVHVFSPRIKEHFFLPVFIDLVKKDTRYAIAIIPMILTICEILPDDKIISKALEPLKPAFENPNNPQLAKIIMMNVEFLSSKLPSSALPDYILPSVYYALSSNNSELVELAVTHLSDIVETLPASAITEKILPNLARFLPGSKDAHITGYFMRSFARCAEKVDHDAVAGAAVPAIQKLWRSHAWPEMVPGAAELLVRLRLRADTMLHLTVPLATEFLAAKEVGLDTQRVLFDYILSSVSSVRAERGIAGEAPVEAPAAPSAREAEARTDPFAARTKKEKKRESSSADSGDPFGQSQSQQKPQKEFSDPFGQSQQKPQKDFGFGGDESDTPKKPAQTYSDPFGQPQPQQKPQKEFSDPFGQTQNAPSPQPKTDFSDPFGQSQTQAKPQKEFNDPFGQSKQKPQSGFGDPFGQSPKQTYNDPFGQTQPQQKPQKDFSDPFGQAPKQSLGQEQPRKSFDDPFGQSQPQQTPKQSFNDPFGQTQNAPPPQPTQSFNDPFGQSQPQQKPQNDFNDPFGQSQPQQKPKADFSDPFGQQTRPQPKPAQSFSDPFGQNQQKPQKEFNDPFEQPQPAQTPKQTYNDPFGQSQQPPQQKPQSGFGDPFGQTPKQSFGQEMPQTYNDPFGQPQPQQTPKQSFSDPFEQTQNAPPPQPKADFSDPFGQTQPQQKPTQSFNEPFGQSQPQQKPQSGFGDPFGQSQQTPKQPYNDPFGQRQPQRPAQQNQFAGFEFD